MEISRVGCKGVPAYRVLPDRSLVSLASLKPMTESELLEVHGIGPSKFEKYGKELLEMIKSECSVTKKRLSYQEIKELLTERSLPKLSLEKIL